MKTKNGVFKAKIITYFSIALNIGKARLSIFNNYKYRTRYKNTVRKTKKNTKLNAAG
ncbi:hypothetical protein [Sphingobacterium sp. ML3W]|uniref:hypothetical protein n=1 Tax=Sphingobacterium sp. ML3W TaxID=1538644 RepID=UPI00130EF057|nr:hypothetical protein [Sphingobacterium sp. ML3W]